MKLKKIAAVLLLSSVTATPLLAAEKPLSDADKLSYSLGALSGNSLKELQLDINKDVFVKGLLDALENKKMALTQAQMMEELQKARQASEAKIKKDLAEQSQVNLKKGQAFLKENGKKPGVKTTASGLQYKVMTTGKGAKPSADGKVTVHYEGKLLDGKVFDSSFKRNQPATFGVKQVIPGWTEALQLMPEGSTYELYIPSDLAYGPNGAPRGGIGPNEVLIFKVELIKAENL